MKVGHLNYLNIELWYVLYAQIQQQSRDSLRTYFSSDRPERRIGTVPEHL